MSNSLRQAGFTLIEMIIAIVIIGVGIAGLFTAFNTNVRASGDPIVHKQMLAIAEESLEEILLKPFAITGTAPVNALVNCGSAGAVRSAFDDVRDYAGYATTGICNIDGETVAGLGSYNLAVTVASTVSLSDGSIAVAGGNTLRVTVTVTQGSETLSLIGWRTNYGS